MRHLLPANFAFNLNLRPYNLGDAPSKSALGSCLMNGDARAGVAKDAARGFALLREAVQLGFTPALFHVAQGYMSGVGVEQDAAHGVTLLRQVIEQGDAAKPMVWRCRLTPGWPWAGA